jgi:hypothetical protein
MSHGRNAVTTTLLLVMLLAVFPTLTLASPDVANDGSSSENQVISATTVTTGIYSQINIDAKYCEIIGSKLTSQADWLGLFVERLTLVKERLEKKVDSSSGKLHIGLLEKMKNILDELGELLPKVIKLRDDVSLLSRSACKLPAVELRAEFATLYDQKEDIREEMNILMSSMKEIYGTKFEIGMKN